MDFPAHTSVIKNSVGIDNCLGCMYLTPASSRLVMNHFPLDSTGTAQYVSSSRQSSMNNTALMTLYGDSNVNYVDIFPLRNVDIYQ